MCTYVYMYEYKYMKTVWYRRPSSPVDDPHLLCVSHVRSCRKELNLARPSLI